MIGTAEVESDYGDQHVTAAIQTACHQRLIVAVVESRGISKQIGCAAFDLVTNKCYLSQV
jgi:hypothetical protein